MKMELNKRIEKGGFGNVELWEGGQWNLAFMFNSILI
jgi:hypothetical protein